ncbi:MAG: hypothetical protein KDD21_01640 [Bacteroidetes bacterium]|nr:hypothetical protein [Bacteroidota bacterium]
MFDFFKKKNVLKTTDYIFRSEEAKYQKLAVNLLAQKKVLLLYYFEDTKQQLINILQANNIAFSEIESAAPTVYLLQASTLLNKINISDYHIIFAEHHPSFQIENNIKQHLVETLSQNEVIFYTSLEDVLLQKFGSERIIAILDKMGFKEDEIIEHKMISDSIINVQQKIDKQLQFTSDTRMRKDWFEINKIDLT